MKKHIILVFANLKPSQVIYKIIPLSRSEYVEKIIILRKEYMEIGNKKIACLSLPWLLKIRPFYWFFTSFYGIYLIRKHKVTLILNYNILPHGFNAWIASLFTNRPVIFADINEDTIKYHRNILTRPLINNILRNATWITTPGSSTEAYWNQNGFSNTKHLHSTIDTETFFPDVSVKKVYDFIFIGEFDNNKRPDLILKAFLSLRQRGSNQLKLCIIGFGLLEKKLHEIISDNGLEECVSVIKTNQIIDYVRKSKILVMASLSEGIPCVILESMACELIVLAPPVGDISDVVNHNSNGFLHNNSEEDLINCMLNAYTEYNNLGNLRKAARQTIIDKHSYQSALVKWNNLLQLAG